MLLFGHIGVGAQLARPFAGKTGHFRLPDFLWVGLGTLLPDIIDKSLFFLNRHWSFAPELITSSRTVGHTALLLLLLGFTAWSVRLRPLALAVLGMATHLLLDNVSDRLLGVAESSAHLALVFPTEGWRFASYPFESFGEHFRAMLNPVTLGFEGLGMFLLSWEAWKQAYLKEVVIKFRALRHEPKGRHKLQNLFQFLRER
jgi:hypothetical protein